MKSSIVFLLLCFAAGAFAQPTTRPDELTLRAQANIQRFRIMKVVLADTDLDEATKAAIVKAADDANTATLAALEHAKTDPSDPGQLAQSIQQINEKFKTDAKPLMDADRSLQQKMAFGMAHLQSELRKIADGSIVAELASTDLSESQQKQIDDICTEVADKVKALDEPKARLELALDARKRIYGVLTEDQLKQWKQKLALESPGVVTRRIAPVAPAKPAAPVAPPP